MPPHECRNGLLLGRKLSMIRSHPDIGKDKAIPFPVTVIGVIVVEARAARTGVPAAATDTSREAATKPKVQDFMVERSWNREGRKQDKKNLG
jgi:hypothetical protein